MITSGVCDRERKLGVICTQWTLQIFENVTASPIAMRDIQPTPKHFEILFGKLKKVIFATWQYKHSSLALGICLFPYLTLYLCFWRASCSRRFITESTAGMIKDDSCPSSGSLLVKRKGMAFKKTISYQGSEYRWNVDLGLVYTFQTNWNCSMWQLSARCWPFVCSSSQHREKESSQKMFCNAKAWILQLAFSMCILTLTWKPELGR